MSDYLPPEHRFVRRVPPGDERERLVCDSCEFVYYQNPKIIVGSVCTHEGRYLLCRRAINPRKGFWTLPAGFLEENETSQAGAAREAKEEALASIEINALLAVYDIPHRSQVQLLYRAVLTDPRIAPGPESIEVRLFEWEEIPWQELAFVTVRWALEAHRAVGDSTVFPPFVNPAV